MFFFKDYMLLLAVFLTPVIFALIIKFKLTTSILLLDSILKTSLVLFFILSIPFLIYRLTTNFKRFRILVDPNMVKLGFNLQNEYSLKQLVSKIDLKNGTSDISLWKNKNEAMFAFCVRTFERGDHSGTSSSGPYIAYYRKLKSTINKDLDYKMLDDRVFFNIFNAIFYTRNSKNFSKSFIKSNVNEVEHLEEYRSATMLSNKNYEFIKKNIIHYRRNQENIFIMYKGKKDFKHLSMLLESSRQYTDLINKEYSKN